MISPKKRVEFEGPKLLVKEIWFKIKVDGAEMIKERYMEYNKEGGGRENPIFLDKEIRIKVTVKNNKIKVLIKSCWGVCKPCFYQKS